MAAALWLLATPVGAQTPPPASTTAAPAAQSAVPAQDVSRYNPAGRRDPFVSLLRQAGDVRSTSSRPEGLAGVLIDEVVIKALFRMGTGFIALVQAPDTKVYQLKAGDRLMDGTVKTILGDSVIFLREITNPLSTVKQEEVRKMIRPVEHR
jgi:hypothetical protein